MSKKEALLRTEQTLSPLFRGAQLADGECLILISTFKLTDEERRNTADGADSGVYAHIAGSQRAVEETFVQFFENDDVMLAPVVAACLEVMGDFIKIKHKDKVFKGLRKYIAARRAADRSTGGRNMAGASASLNNLLRSIRDRARDSIMQSSGDLTPVDILERLHGTIGAFVEKVRREQTESNTPQETPVNQQF